MKSPLISLLALLLLAQASVAQRNAVEDIDRENFFRIGAKGTVSINKIPGDTYNDGFNFNYQLGGFLQFNFSKRFGIQPEVNFIQASSAYTNDITNVTEDLFHEGAQAAQKLNMLEIPILLNINVGESKHVKLQVGPSYGMYLKGVTTNKETDNNLQYKNNVFGALGGLWIQLPFINFGGRYHYRFDKTENPLTKQSGENQAIEIFTGFTF